MRLEEMAKSMAKHTPSKSFAHYYLIEVPYGFGSLVEEELSSELDGLYKTITETEEVDGVKTDYVGVMFLESDTTPANVDVLVDRYQSIKM